MKKILMLGFLALLVYGRDGRAQSAAEVNAASPLFSHVWAGKLDLTSNPTAGLYRELHDGNWIGAVSKKVWVLQEDGQERFHVGPMLGWRTDRGNPFVGANMGIPSGTLGAKLHQIAAAIDPQLDDNVKWAVKAADFVSVDCFIGRRFNPAPDVHLFVYGIGGKVGVPIDTVLSWLKMGI